MPAQGNPTPPLVGGNSVRNPILSDYVFQSGIHKPEHSNILTYKYPQYYATALMDRLGAFEPIAQDTWSWNILDRTREGGTVSSLSATGSTTIDFEVTEFDFTSADLGYVIVNDVLRFPSGAEGIVTAVAVSSVLSNKQKITVRKVGGGNWGASDIANADVFGHVFNAFPEASSAPNGRLYLPKEEYNVLTTLRRTIKISGDELTNRTYLGDGRSWYFTIEDIEMKEFARDRELLVMFGQRDTGTNKISKVILQYAIDSGVSTTYSPTTGVTEADIQEHIRKLTIEDVSNEIWVLCGSQFLKDAQVALRDYQLNNGARDNQAGLDFQSYKFLGKTIHFAYYAVFEDTGVVPFAGNPTSAKINFSDFSLWLDMGSTSTGHKLITLKYKELQGESRKFVHAYKTGMVNAYGQSGGQVASGDDAFEVYYLSQIGVEVKLPNRLGILRAQS